MSNQPENTSDVFQDEGTQVVNDTNTQETVAPDVIKEQDQTNEENLGNKDNITVQNEPQEQQQEPRRSSLNATAFLESTIDNIAVTFSSKLNPLAKKLGRSIDQVRQVL